MQTTSKTLPVIIFDWDDTLLDAGQILCAAQHQAITSILQEKEKYPFTQRWQCPSPTELREHTGHRFKEVVIFQVLPQIDKNNVAHQRWLDDVYQRFLEYYQTTPKRLFPGIDAMLKTLKAHGHILCIATNKSRKLLAQELIATNVEALFTYTATADDPHIKGQSKPQPTMIDQLQSHFPAQTKFVMVGDRKFDIEAAQASKNAHITMTIGITGGQPTRLQIADVQLNSATCVTTEKIKEYFQ